MVLQRGYTCETLMSTFDPTLKSTLRYVQHSTQHRSIPSPSLSFTLHPSLFAALLSYHDNQSNTCDPFWCLRNECGSFHCMLWHRNDNDNDTDDDGDDGNDDDDNDGDYAGDD